MVKIGSVQVVGTLELDIQGADHQSLEEDVHSLGRDGLDGRVDGFVDRGEEGDGADLLLVPEGGRERMAKTRLGE